MAAHGMGALRRSLRRPALLLCALVLGGDVLVAQQVRVIQRDSSRRDSIVLRADSIFFRFSTAEPDELLRQVTLLREREARLLTELRATPSTNVALQRQIAEQLAQLSRESFTLMSVVESRCATERWPRPEGYLGITLSSEGEVSAGRIRSIGRAAVESVDPGSPAQRGGIAAGDWIVSIAGRDFSRGIPDIDDLLQVGNRLGVRIERDGRERDLMLTVGRRAQNVDRTCGQFERVLQPLRMMGPGRILVESTGDGRTQRVEVRAAPSPTRDPRVVRTPDQERSFFIFAPGAAGVTDIAFFGGAEFRPLSNDWREVLGMARGSTGVIVSEVAPGSMAAQAGLREGDVITGVGGANATSPEVLVRLLSVSAQRDATLRVVRGKSTKTVVLPTSRP